jgi:hypothetical protein
MVRLASFYPHRPPLGKPVGGLAEGRVETAMAVAVEILLAVGNVGPMASGPARDQSGFAFPEGKMTRRRIDQLSSARLRMRAARLLAPAKAACNACAVQLEL